VLAATEVSAEAKARLQALHARLNPFQLARDIERQKKAIEAGASHFFAGRTGCRLAP
jgi:hypothetical protein